MNEYGLLSFKEYGEANGPSITTLFSDTKYENQDVIADYLDKGEVSMVAASFEKDVVTDEYIKPARTKCIKTNGKHSWDGSLSYYIRKYNLRFPKSIEDAILEDISNLEATT